MNKKWLKFSLYILIILTTVVLTSTVVLGYNYSDFESSGSSNGPAQVLDISIDFLAIVKVVGYILGVVFIVILAIQFLIATPNKKAELKTRSWMYTLGIILLIAIPTMMDWTADMGKSISAGGGSSGSGSGGGTDLQSHLQQEDAGSNGIGGFWNIFRGKSKGDSSGGSGDSNSPTTPTTSTTPAGGTTPSGNTTVTTPATPTDPPAQTSGYKATTASDPKQLKAGDRIYFTVDASGNPNGGWNNSDIYYDLQPGDSVIGGFNGYALSFADGSEWDLGEMMGKPNCFESDRERWLKQPSKEV